MDIMAIRSNFKSLRAQLEAKEGRRISYKEIVDYINSVAEKRGIETISEPTLIRFANDKVSSVSYNLLEGLSLYFNEHGFEVKPGDFLLYNPEYAAA